MSWGHTASFFSDNGFGGGYDPYYGVFLVECLFLMGAGAEIYLRKVGQRSTWAIKAALGVGAITVFWANLRHGLAHGWEGMAAGSIIIVAIVIAENVIADTLLSIQQRNQAEQAGDIVRPTGVDPGDPATVGDLLEKRDESREEVATVAQAVPQMEKDSPKGTGLITHRPGDHPGSQEISQAITQEPGDIPSGIEEIPEESPIAQEITQETKESPKPKRFTQEEIRGMAAQIRETGELTKREIMATLSISDHYAKKVMAELKSMGSQETPEKSLSKLAGEASEGGIENGNENERDHQSAHTDQQSHTHTHQFTTSTSTEKEEALRPGA